MKTEQGSGADAAAAVPTAGDEISGLIRRVRRMAKWSQRELADELGVSQSAVAKWETGRTCPSARMLARVLRFAKLSLVAVKPDGGRVAPMKVEAARDAALRRYPAHTFVWAEGWWAPEGAEMTAWLGQILRTSKELGLAKVRYSRWWQLSRPPTLADIHEHPTWPELVAEAREGWSPLRRRSLVPIPEWAFADTRKARNRWPRGLPRPPHARRARQTRDMNFSASTTTRVTSPAPTTRPPSTWRAETVKRCSRPSTYAVVAVTSSTAPTGLAARCSSVIRVPTLVPPSGSAASIAAQVAASHHASSRGRAEHRQRPAADGDRGVVVGDGEGEGRVLVGHAAILGAEDCRRSREQPRRRHDVLEGVTTNVKTPAEAVGLSELYAAHRLALVRLAVLLVDDLASAEDVVQDAFAALARRKRRAARPVGRGRLPPGRRWSTAPGRCSAGGGRSAATSRRGRSSWPVRRTGSSWPRSTGRCSPRVKRAAPTPARGAGAALLVRSLRGRDRRGARHQPRAP